jgi:enolase-phosphatase E1
MVYDDVPKALARWTAAGRRVAIFSSGSVLAQKLIFGHSDKGDLTRYLSGYFDTTTGPKREAESYRRIAAALGEQPAGGLFLSDVVAELDAAREAGFATGLVVREPPGPELNGHRAVASFDALD